MKQKNKKILITVIGIVLFCFLFTGNVLLYKNQAFAYWMEEENGKRYTLEDGSLAVGFFDIEGKRYYFDSDGYVLSGKFYVEQEDAYYFADEEGVVQTGVIKTDNLFYVADETGRLQKGFVEYDNDRYYFDSAANLVSGWFKVDGNWYFADYTGVMLTGFLDLDGYRYYLNADGTRVSDTIMEIDGVTYIFNSDGSIDENATAMYPVYQYIAKKREEIELPEIKMNSKVQACAVLRASDLKNGYALEEGSTKSIENLLKNRGVESDGGFEFSYGGVEDYGTENMISDMEKDLNFSKVLKDASVTEIGIGYYEKDDICYYDIIFIFKKH